MANRKDIQRAVEWEREKWRSTMVYWDDQHGNRHIVPVVRITDGGERICIEIPRPSAAKEAPHCPTCDCGSQKPQFDNVSTKGE